MADIAINTTGEKIEQAANGYEALVTAVNTRMTHVPNCQSGTQVRRLKNGQIFKFAGSTSEKDGYYVKLEDFTVQQENQWYEYCEKIGGEAGSTTEVQIDGTSITSQGTANIKTTGEYSDSNKVVTESYKNKLIKIGYSENDDFDALLINTLFYCDDDASSLYIKVAERDESIDWQYDYSCYAEYKDTLTIINDSANDVYNSFPAYKLFGCYQSDDLFLKISDYEGTGNWIDDTSIYCVFIEGTKPTIKSTFEGNDVPSTHPTDFSPSVNEGDFYFCTSNQTLYRANTIGETYIGWSPIAFTTIKSSGEPPTETTIKYELGQLWNYTHNNTISGTTESQLYYLAAWRFADDIYTLTWKELTGENGVYTNVKKFSGTDNPNVVPIANVGIGDIYVRTMTNSLRHEIWTYDYSQSGAQHWRIVAPYNLVVEIALSDWTNKEATITGTGYGFDFLHSGSNVIVSPDVSDIDNYAKAGIYCSNVSEGSITFKCNTTPTEAITVNVLVQ